jgi:heme exporter protein C
MPRIMSGLHPGSADDTNSGPVIDFKMNANMQLIFFLSLTGFTILYFWMWNLGYRSILLKNKFNKQSLKE